MKDLFVVCWVLMHQPVAGQENCTPGLAYGQAQAVMSYIAGSEDNLKLSMSLLQGGPQVKPKPLTVSPAPAEK